ncbi:unnamed protein product [Didymodactylos carnosus]|uniref:PDZ domain-containing protein n=1 Tax=Didymodactylos carnosus TaxID=1234261 RepID=A0A814RNN3_9BILA|nr:unnamed protein product [Didymodactylos carnosus]CAF1460562.1 unnamed protein product [Didymodactylos carnosus]CAF3898689.1 unnamed protein product [Didymodactylos carnosus]CAF4253922.1 unnamed protein product [Didymodactylos carnosus]
MSSDERDYENEPHPRLCHLRRWNDFVGYGFNLHCEKSKPGQFIGKVDPNSPAEAAGLREHDRIIEVNFVNIGNENHKQVVTRIKEGVSRDGTKYPDEVILLVLDTDADDYYKNRNIVVRSNDSNVKKMETPQKSHENNTGLSSHFNTKSSESSLLNSNPMKKTVTPIQHDSPPSPDDHDTNNHYKQPSLTRIPQEQYKPPAFTSLTQRTDENVKVPSPKPSYEHSRSSPVGSNYRQQSGNNTILPELAAEFREQLKAANKRDKDPRKQQQQMSMRDKHELIERL